MTAAHLPLATPDDAPVLSVVDLCVAYGGVQALDSVSLTLMPETVVALIGPNGAGKTTLFQALTAAVPVQSGRIVWRGQSLLGMPPHTLAGLGLVRMAQQAAVFQHLTVQDHLQLATHPLRTQRKPRLPVQDWMEEVIDQLLIGVLTRGHCLLVGVPGLAKTLLISSLARTLDLSFNRIQFTPDLMPADITGTEVIQQDPTTGEHDEDKAFIGFDSAEAARACFAAAYDRNDLKMGPVRSMTTSELSEWLAERDNRGRKIEAGALLSKAVQENDMLSKGKHFLDEDLAQKAHAAVAEQYGLGEKDGERYWRLKSAIYQKMGGTFAKSQGDEADDLLRSAGGLPTSQTYGTPAKVEKPTAASPPPAPPPVAKPHHHQDAMQLPTKPTKKFPPPSHPKPTRAPLALMSTPGEMQKAQRIEADALLKAAGGEPAPVKRYSVTAPAGKSPKKPSAPAQSNDLARLAAHHDKMAKMHGDAVKEALKAGDGKTGMAHSDARLAHEVAAHAARAGGGPETSEASQKAKAATEATLPKTDAGSGKPAAAASAGDQGGIGGRSKEGLKVIAIGPRGGKIVGYVTKDGKQKAIYEGSQAAAKLAATVATHAEPAKAEPEAKDAAAPAAPADAAPSASAAEAKADGETPAGSAAAEKPDDAAAPAPADAPQDAPAGDQAAAPAPASPSEPIDDKPLSPDEPAGGTPSDAPDPEQLGSASPKTDSPESRHADEIAKMQERDRNRLKEETARLDFETQPLQRT